MKRGTFIFILVILLVFALSTFIIILINGNQSSTGKTIDNQVKLLNITNLTPELNQEDQIFIYESQSLEANTIYTKTFSVLNFSTIFVSIDSDKKVNYVFLPESEVEDYKRNRGFNSYEFKTRIVFLQGHYNLYPGDYSVVISSLDNPVNFHLIINVTAI